MDSSRVCIIHSLADILARILCDYKLSMLSTEVEC